MARYRRMTDPGYESPFIAVIPGIPASMEPDRDPEYEYKDKLDEDDDIWEWGKCEDEEADIWVEYDEGWYSEKAFKDPDADADFPDDYHKEWRESDETDESDEKEIDLIIEIISSKEAIGCFAFLVLMLVIILIVEVNL